MIFIGIDPSLTNTGVIAINEKGDLMASVSITSKPVGKKPIDELVRIKNIVNKIEDFISGYKEVSMVVIEGIAMMARNSTALVQLSGLNYMIRDMLLKRGVSFSIVTPTQLKKFITGKGNSQKNIIMLEVYKQYGFSFTDDNICDAFVLAKIGFHIVDTKSDNMSQSMTVKQSEVINSIISI